MISPADHCYRHTDRPAAVGCQRCDQPICSSCMKSASVGFHCPGCAKAGAQKVSRGIPGRGSSMPAPVLAIIAINVVMFFVDLVIGDDSSMVGQNSFLDQIFGWGVLLGPVIQEDGDYFRIVSSAFLHVNIIHLAMNMYFISVLGPIVHQLFGTVRFLAIYAVALFGGSAAVLWFDWGQPTVGASGAALGLAGAVAGAYVSTGRPLNQIPMIQRIALNLGLPLLIGGISFWGHFGGIAAGFVAGFVAQRFAQEWRTQQKLETLVFGVLIVGIAGLAVVGANAGDLSTFYR